MAEEAQKAPTQQTGAAPGTQLDPYRGYYFKVYIGGAVQAGFTNVSGGGMTVECITHAGGDDVEERHVPGRVHYDNVVLQYGLTDSQELWQWFLQVVAGTYPLPRKNVAIVLMDAAGTTEKLHWTLYNAWPTRWQPGPLNSMSSSILIHTLELCYDHLDRQ